MAIGKIGVLAAGRLGRKTGYGCHTYRQKGKE